MEAVLEIAVAVVMEVAMTRAIKRARVVDGCDVGPAETRT